MQSAKITIELPEAMEIDGKEVQTLEFREPTGADMERFLGEMIPSGGGKPDMGKSITAIAAATILSHPLEEEDFRKMRAKNYMAIATELMGFLA